jgi:hypothetical protein
MLPKTTVMGKNESAFSIYKQAQLEFQKAIKKKKKAEEPFLQRLFEIIHVIDSYYRSGKGKSAEDWNGSNHFDLSELEKPSDIKSENVKLYNSGIRIQWSGHNHYFMTIPISYAELSDTEIREVLEDEDMSVFNREVFVT